MDGRLARVTWLTAMIWMLGAVPSFAASPGDHAGRAADPPAPVQVAALDVRADQNSRHPAEGARVRPTTVTPEALPLVPPPAPEVRLPAPAAVIPPLGPHNIPPLRSN
jgi:hypothetical protein